MTTSRAVLPWTALLALSIPLALGACATRPAPGTDVGSTRPATDQESPTAVGSNQSGRTGDAGHALVPPTSTATSDPPVADVPPAAPAPPTGPGSRWPALAAGDDGRLHLAWVEPVAGDGDTLAVRVSAWDGAAWSPAETVVAGTDVVAHWTAAPAIAASADGTRAVQWLAAAASDRPGMGTDIRLTIARSDGAWQDAAPVHAPAAAAENGFAAVVPDGAGFGLLWLDARRVDAAAGADGTSGTSGSPDVGLRYAFVGVDGSLGTDVEVDGRVCECCAVDVDVAAVAAGAPSRLVAAYRDRSPDEVRDIAVAYSDERGWSAPVVAHVDGWRTNACPVNGPAVDALGSAAVVAWFAAPPGGPALVQAAWSDDGGRTFGPPVRVDDGHPQGQVDIVRLADGAVLVSWLEAGALHVRRVEWVDDAAYGTSAAGTNPGGSSAAGGRSSSATAMEVVTVPGVSIDRGRPRLVGLGDEVWLAWADGGAEGRVRVRQLRHMDEED